MQVLRIPFEDHGPPLLCEMLQFCEQASKFMLKDPRNVIAVHCKGGKGRTGVLIACLLLWTGHRRVAMDALELFTFRSSYFYFFQRSCLSCIENMIQFIPLSRLGTA